jgi:hypothetical protein
MSNFGPAARNSDRRYHRAMTSDDHERELFAQAFRPALNPTT